jgi:hypothetical protein
MKSIHKEVSMLTIKVLGLAVTIAEGDQAARQAVTLSVEARIEKVTDRALFANMACWRRRSADPRSW